MKTNRILLVAALGGMWLGGCTRDDRFAEPAADAVTFTAEIETKTRTTSGGDAWVVGDAVGMFMLTAGSNLSTPADILADNVQYNVTDAATGALAPESGTPIFYPQSGNVDFVAYYPHRTTPASDPYLYKVSVAGQTSEAVQNALDVLYTRANDIAKTKTAVGLTFGHVLSKVTLNVTAGTGFAAAEISGLAASAVAFGGMPTTAALDLQDGALTAGTDLAQTFNPLKNTTPPSGFDASFTALLVPQAANAYTNRTVAFTVGGQTYTWTIPSDDDFTTGSHYTYPVTVNKTGITVGAPQITPWTTRESGSGEAEQVQIVPEANSYMVEPDGAPILIPVSQANKAADPNYNLGADATGLGGVEAGNFTVELVWGDTPVGADGVIEKIRADGEYVYVKPGAAGNAVVAIRDKDSGTIKWSWHIWVTEPVGQGTDEISGVTWMDRNLGAAGTTYDANGKNGLFYQWGRKDAFPGSNGTNASQIYYIGDATTGTTENLPIGSYTELPQLVQNPLTFTADWDYYGSLNVEGTDNKSWSNGGAKTLYDPCPAGWRVPENGKWSSSDNVIRDPDTEWPSGWNNGRVFNGVNGTAALGHFYPESGYRHGETGDPTGSNGEYWSATPSSNEYAHDLYFTSSTVNPQYSGRRAFGFAVRCVAEVSDTPKPATVVAEANSYMVVPNGGAILIPVSQANKAADPNYNLGADATGLGGVEAGNFTVELVWGDTPVGADGMIEEMFATGNHVYVKPGAAGNAVIAIRDKITKKIKWSWHIWVTEPVGQSKDSKTGLTWMDRNLGAAGTTYDTNGKNGLFYQWGRKDAFPGSDGTDINQVYYIGGATTATTAALPTSMETSYKLSQLVQTPLAFATNWQSYRGSLNMGESNKSWDDEGKKTLYDPCPAGWRVPENGKWSSVSLGHFYPASGYRDPLSAALTRVGSEGAYWSATPNSVAHARYLGFSNGEISPQNNNFRAHGYAVRCVAE